MSNPKRHYRLWGPPSLFLMGIDVLSEGQSGRSVKLTTHLHLVMRLIMSTAVTLLLLLTIEANEMHYFSNLFW